MELVFQAKVLTVSTDVKTKQNAGNSTYVVTTVEFLDGPAKGKTAFANRTLSNADGVAKANVAVDQEVTVHGTVVTNRDTQKPMVMWEIQSGASVTDADELSALLGLDVAVDAEVKIDAN